MVENLEAVATSRLVDPRRDADFPGSRVVGRPAANPLATTIPGWFANNDLSRRGAL